jgi:hypothetical protein
MTTLTNEDRSYLEAYVKGVKAQRNLGAFYQLFNLDFDTEYSEGHCDEKLPKKDKSELERIFQACKPERVAEEPDWDNSMFEVWEVGGLYLRFEACSASQGMVSAYITKVVPVEPYSESVTLYRPLTFD